MSDEMDYYLGRSLKNWAASKRPPADGRAKLLWAAASPPVQRERLLQRIIKQVCNYQFFSHPVSMPVENTFGPYSQSRYYSIHIATNWRWAS